jgi:hypothetical protein
MKKELLQQFQIHSNLVHKIQVYSTACISKLQKMAGTFRPCQMFYPATSSMFSMNMP